MMTRRTVVPALAGIVFGLLLVCGALMPIGRAGATTGIPDTDADAAVRLDDDLRANRFIGAALVARGGSVLLSRGYGQANAELDVANTPRTRFRLASVTKQFTAAAILLLQERGRLRVDASVCDYLDACPPAWRPITVQHLLSHTSGIQELFTIPEFRRSSTVGHSVRELLGMFRDRPLQSEPGAAYGYSNSGYVVLGAIVEAVSGRPWDQFLEEEVFAPAGMRDTGQDRPGLVVKNRAAGYQGAPDNLFNAAFFDSSNGYAAGALYSTVEDLYRWDRALTEGRILAPASVDAMFRANARAGGVFYADGWMVVPPGAPDGRPAMSFHGGGINGFSACVARYPDVDVYVALLSNVEGRNLCGPSLRRIESIVLPPAGV